MPHYEALLAESLDTTVRVDIAALLGNIVAFVRRFVLLTEAQAIAIALWVVLTHAIDAFDFAAYLAINSPEKRCGKSRCMEILELLVARPLKTTHISTAALFRIIDKEHPTLLLDEMDAAFKGDKDYAEASRGILNGGYQRGSPVARCDGKAFEVRRFDVFGPKAMAGIGKPPDTIIDRSIPIDLTRKTPEDSIAPFRRRYVSTEVEELVNQIRRWTVSALPSLRESRPDLPQSLNDRQQDVWEPLLAIADHARATIGVSGQGVPLCCFVLMTQVKTIPSA